MTPDDPNQIPKETTPTWEMELLISGATVFGLMQLPGKLDQLFFDLANRSSHLVGTFAFTLWIYAKISVVTLITTFILHLIARGFWVALVGLHSVYPGGIRLSRLKGALYRQVLEQQPGIPERIERADNRATRIFGVGFGLAMLMLVPFVVVLILLGFGLVGEALHREKQVGILVGALALLIGLPLAIASLVDRQLGARLRPEGRLARALVRCFHFAQRLGFARESNPLLSLFTTNEPRWRGFALIACMALVPGGFVMGQFLFDTGEVHFGRFDGLPAELSESPEVISPQHYASTRGEVHTLSPLAYIPEKIVQGSYLELSIPYRPARDVPALRKVCSAELDAVAQGEAARPALDCIGRALDIRVDGKPVQVPLHASTDPTSGWRVLLAMIPVGNLAAGLHELVLSRPTMHDDDDKPIPAEHIPFWR